LLFSCSDYQKFMLENLSPQQYQLSQIFSKFKKLPISNL